MASVTLELVRPLEAQVVGARSGVIVTEAGRLTAVRPRLIPKWVTFRETLWARQWLGRLQNADRCRLYYHQPRGVNYLTLKYIVSSPGATFATVRCAMRALDCVARMKGVDFIVCHVANDRISDRVLARWGWTRHCPNRRGRHFIKRFYGCYPDGASIADLQRGD